MGEVPDPPPLHDLLAAAVNDLGGDERSGQVRMAEAVARAMDTGEHLLVQAGTGTGKSLAYLVPALRHARPVVISTATLALQAQLVRRDLPRLVEALAPSLGRQPRFAILKGRGNYACLNRLEAETELGEAESGEAESGEAESGEAESGRAAALFEAPTGRTGREVRRVRQWALDSDTGDRDDLSPGVADRVWSQVSVSARECVGANRCAHGPDCFAELARERAAAADVVITNHALLAIDASGDAAVLPDHDAVIIDEGHELVDRVTAVATAELTAAAIDRAARSAAKVAARAGVEALQGLGESLDAALAGLAPGRLDPLPPLLGGELAALREAARSVTTTISTSRDDTQDQLLAAQIARTALTEIHDVAERLVGGSEAEVAWLADEDRRGRVLRVAPLSVADRLRSSLFARRCVVVTSATLALGDAFDIAARSFGLGAAADGAEPVGPAGGDGTDVQAPPPPTWRGLDVGSPFDYPRQGILYVARHLPPPGRDGLSEALLDELADLVDAAGGRTLGLFSSRRAAEQAAAALRDRRAQTVSCQGEATLTELVRAFAARADACLFGTLSLWQGVDVPGPACQLVVIDRIPFPRPDEPLEAARAAAVEAAGGNGFMTVSAARAAVRLAQGSGRLIRRGDDRGVVAVLDSRLASARYGAFLRRSMPPFWYTTAADVVRAALRRIDTAAGAPAPVGGAVASADRLAEPAAVPPPGG